MAAVDFQDRNKLMQPHTFPRLLVYRDEELFLRGYESETIPQQLSCPTTTRKNEIYIMVEQQAPDKNCLVSIGKWDLKGSLRSESTSGPSGAPIEGGFMQDLPVLRIRLVVGWDLSQIVFSDNGRIGLSQWKNPMETRLEEHHKGVRRCVDRCFRLRIAVCICCRFQCEETV